MPKLPPKKRTEQIFATTEHEVDAIEVRFLPTNDLEFGQPMIRVFSEKNYDRPKSPKVISRIPQDHGSVTFTDSKALMRNYDFLCAVDTNTKMICDKVISVTGITICEFVWVSGPAGTERHYRCHVPFCIKFVNLLPPQENFAWLVALERLRDEKYMSGNDKVGIIVDSDLGNIQSYNDRTQPVYDKFYLDKAATLVYATSDAGKDYIVNRCLAMSDNAASHIIRILESSQHNIGVGNQDSPYCDEYCLVFPKGGPEGAI